MRQQQFIMPGSDVDPIASRHDVRTTQATIKEMLKSGTPDWVRFPHEYKNFARESYLADKELSDEQVAGYKIDDQELLVNEKARKVNIVRTRDFIRVLRNNGVRCFTVDNGMLGTVGLWVLPKENKPPVYICYLQIPYMCQWSVLRTDRHGLPNGEDYRGWRTVLAQLIVKGALSETRIHEIFAAPTDSLVSRRYRRTLFNFRNGVGRQAEATL